MMFSNSVLSTIGLFLCFISVPESMGQQPGFATFVLQNGNRHVLDVPTTFADNTQVGFGQPRQSNTELWYLEPGPGGAVQLISFSNGLALSGQGNDAIATINRYNNLPNQIWHVVPSGSGGLLLRNGADGGLLVEATTFHAMTHVFAPNEPVGPAALYHGGAVPNLPIEVKRWKLFGHHDAQAEAIVGVNRGGTATSRFRAQVNVPLGTTAWFSMVLELIDGQGDTRHITPMSTITFAGNGRKQDKGTGPELISHPVPPQICDLTKNVRMSCWCEFRPINWAEKAREVDAEARRRAVLAVQIITAVKGGGG